MNLKSAVRYLAILRDTLGMDGKSHANRNLFSTKRGTSDYLDCCFLTEHGYLRAVPQGQDTESFQFMASDQGKKALNLLGLAVVADWKSKPERLARERFHLDGTPMEPNGTPVQGAYNDGEAELRTPEGMEATPF